MTRIKIKNENGEWETMPIIKGEPGEKGIPGEKGEKGDESYPIGTIVEYEGDTIPSGFELVEDNSASVIVSSTEPTTGEEVWLQRGKNLFDKNNANIFNGLIDDGSLTWYSNANGCFVILEVKPNTTYTLSKKTAISEFAVASATNTPYIGMVVTKMISGSGKTEVSITTGENDKYLHIYVYYNTVSSGTLEETLNSLEVEEGSSITPKKIHTKTDNGYEEFSNITLKVITPTLESIVKNGQITAIKSGNVVVVEVSDLMLNSDRKEWSTTVATGLPKPLFFPGAWRKSTLLENKGLVQIGNSGEVTICTRTGTQSVNDCYIGQITYISEE